MNIENKSKSRTASFTRSPRLRNYLCSSVFICGSIFLIPMVGCNETVHPTIQGRNDPYQPQQMHFASDELRRDTAISPPVVTRDDAGMLHVTVPIRSAIDKNLYVDYRVTFFDANGQPVNSTSWFNKTLEANTPDRITVNSTTPRAADFQIDFRYAK